MKPYNPLESRVSIKKLVHLTDAQHAAKVFGQAVKHYSADPTIDNLMFAPAENYSIKELVELETKNTVCHAFKNYVGIMLYKTIWEGNKARFFFQWIRSHEISDPAGMLKIYQDLRHDEVCNMIEDSYRMDTETRKLMEESVAEDVRNNESRIVGEGEE